MMQKPFIYTYTNVSTYENTCPYQMFRVYVKKDIPYVGSPEQVFGTQVHDAFDKRVAGKKPLPVEMAQWEPFAAAFDPYQARTELQAAITRDGRPTGYWDNDCFFRGKIDVAVIYTPNASIVDWKTGGSRYESPFEIACGALMLKAANPQLTTIKGRYVWLKENRAGTEYDLSDFNSTWAKLNNIVEKIEDSMASGEWEKRRTPLCGWCRVFDCENNTNSKR